MVRTLGLLDPAFGLRISNASLESPIQASFAFLFIVASITGIDVVFIFLCSVVRIASCALQTVGIGRLGQRLFVIRVSSLSWALGLLDPSYFVCFVS